MAIVKNDVAFRKAQHIKEIIRLRDGYTFKREGYPKSDNPEMDGWNILVRHALQNSDQFQAVADTGGEVKAIETRKAYSKRSLRAMSVPRLIEECKLRGITWPGEIGEAIKLILEFQETEPEQ